MDFQPWLISTFLMNSPDLRLYQLVGANPTKTPGNMDLQEAVEMAPLSPMWLTRGQAVQAYAILEQSLCMLFQYLSSMDYESASIVFFKFSGYRSRNETLDRLLRKRHASEHSLFWNSYQKQLQQIDLNRNSIVHWLAAANVTLDNRGHLLLGINLVPAQSVHNAGTIAEHKTVGDLTDFIERCSIFSRLIVCFTGFLSKPEMFDDRDSWLQIFRQELVYPLSPEHPLFRKPQIPDTPPQSSPA